MTRLFNKGPDQMPANIQAAKCKAHVETLEFASGSVMVLSELRTLLAAYPVSPEEGLLT